MGAIGVSACNAQPHFLGDFAGTEPWYPCGWGVSSVKAFRGCYPCIWGGGACISRVLPMHFGGVTDAFRATPSNI